MSDPFASGVGSRDGKVMPLNELTVPVTDRGFLLGDTVYETMRTYDSCIFALQAHLQRLRDSLQAIGIEDAPDDARLADWLRAATRRLVHAEGGPDEAVVRITVTRGPGPHGMSTRGAGPSTVYILARPLPPAPAEVYSKGLRLVTAKTRRLDPAAQDPRIKAGSALNLVLARLEADRAGVDDALMCDANGNYLEASSANLFVLHHGRFYTAHGEDGVLEGITAQRTRELLEAEGFSGVYGPVTPDVLLAADEVLLTQTTREMIPVVEIDGRPVGSGRPGPVAATLRERFHATKGPWLEAEDGAA